MEQSTWDMLTTIAVFIVLGFVLLYMVRKKPKGRKFLDWLGGKLNGTDSSSSSRRADQPIWTKKMI